MPLAERLLSCEVEAGVVFAEVLLRLRLVPDRPREAPKRAAIDIMIARDDDEALGGLAQARCGEEVIEEDGRSGVLAGLARMKRQSASCGSATTS